MVVGGFPREVSRTKKPEGLQALMGFGRGTFRGARFSIVHSIVVQLMCLQPACAACVFSTLAQYLCVQYSVRAPVCAFKG